MTRPPLRARCAVHPSRPAVDACPRCDRPRCGADAAGLGSTCLACTTEDDQPTVDVPQPGDLERFVRAALASYAVAVVGAPVGSEYVGATVFEYLGPFVVGVICGGAATRAAGTDGRAGEARRVSTAVRAVAAVLAVLGVAFSFVLEGSHDPLSISPDVVLPYAAAVAGALLWTMPPRARAQGLSTDV